MKKRLSFLSLISLVFSLFLSGVVSAESYWTGGGAFNRMFYSAQTSVASFFGLFLGGTGDYLFERILFFFILLCLIFLVLNRIELFKKNIVVIWIITIAVSLLSTRFLGDVSWVKAIILPYSVLGVTLTAILPFFIFFFFIESFSSATLRKMAWVFLGVVFVAIWFARADEIGDPAYIYIVAAVLALIFFLFDRTIQTAYVLSFLKKGNSNANNARILEIRRKILDWKQIQDNPNAGDQDKKRAKELIKSAEKQIKEIIKDSVN